MKAISNYIILAAGIVLIALGYFLAYKIAQRGFPDITERTDTLFLWDTVEIEKPVPKDSIVYKWLTEYLPVHDTTEVHDSVLVDIPIGRKVYQEDSSYYAVVTGPMLDKYPSLDTLKVYREKVYIETVRNIYEGKPYKWTVGPFVHQEIGLDNYYQAKAGIAGDFGFKHDRWRFIPEVGYRWESYDKGAWHAGGRIQFNIIRKK